MLFVVGVPGLCNGLNIVSMNASRAGRRRALPKDVNCSQSVCTDTQHDQQTER